MFKNISYNIFFIFLWFCDLVFAETNHIEEVKSSSLPQLDSTKFLQEIFWLVIFFGILYVFVKRVFFVKIYGIKSTRNERISIYNSLLYIFNNKNICLFILYILFIRGLYNIGILVWLDFLGDIGLMMGFNAIQ